VWTYFYKEGKQINFTKEKKKLKLQDYTSFFSYTKLLFAKFNLTQFLIFMIKIYMCSKI